MNPKTKMLINTAVRDYIKMFPDEYKEVLKVIEIQKQNLKKDMAEIEGHAIKRALHTIPEKLHTMFEQKLTTEEFSWYKSTEGGRWFAKEHPQFRITRHI